MRTALIVILIALMLQPGVSKASCGHGKPIDYRDITEVRLTSEGDLPSLPTIDGRLIDGNFCGLTARVNVQEAAFGSWMCAIDDEGRLRVHGYQHYKSDESAATILQRLRAVLADANAFQIKASPASLPENSVRELDFTRYTVAFSRCGTETSLLVQMVRSSPHKLDADEARVLDLLKQLQKVLTDHMHIFMVS